LRKIITILLPTVLCLLAVLIMVDLHLLRGYYLGGCLFVPEERFRGNFTFTVTKNAEGTLDLYLANNDLRYYPLIVYRNEALFFNLTDSVIFEYAHRYTLLDRGEKIFDTGGGFDCGTGIGLALIRPFESFHLKNVKTDDLIAAETYPFATLAANESFSMPTSDVGIRLYLPVSGFGHHENCRVYSNEFPVDPLMFRSALERER
jgi:hypothetical protein